MLRYKAYIAENKYSMPFASCNGKTPDSAIASIKRRHSPYWQDCYVWAVAITPDGQEWPMHKDYMGWHY